MGKSELVPKRIVNSSGVETTVHVRPDQGNRQVGAPLKAMGAPTPLSTVKAQRLDDEIKWQMHKIDEGFTEMPSNPGDGSEGDTAEGLEHLRHSIQNGHLNEALDSATAMDLRELADAIEAKMVALGMSTPSNDKAE